MLAVFESRSTLPDAFNRGCNRTENTPIAPPGQSHYRRRVESINFSKLALGGTAACSGFDSSARIGVRHNSIFVALVPACAMVMEANWNRFSFSLATLLCKQRSDTSEANKSYRTRLTIASESRSARPLETITREVGHAIGDSALYHSLSELARAIGFHGHC